MKSILMLTPAPPLTSETTALPTLAPLASFNSTVTGLVAAKAETANRAAGQRIRIVKVDMKTVYKKKESGVRRQESECGGRLLTPLLLDC